MKDIRTIKILLAEDFKSTRKIEMEALAELGFHHITEAEHGVSALHKLREEKDIGLIISDWNMPEMSGYELLLEIRANETLRDIPFIMATAQGEKDLALKAVKAGANHFITKPFSPGELADVIEEVFINLDKQETGRHPEIRPGESIPRKTAITVSHIQITDHLVLGVLNHLIDSGEIRPKYFELKTRCMPGWNPVQKSLETGDADAALILAPLAMDLFGHGIPLKLVLFAHRNGSISVKSVRGANGEFLHDFLKSGIFFLPHIMSIHHVLADIFFSEIGLKLGPVGGKHVDVFYEVVPPVNMPGFLRENPESCGFVVAEPFGTKAINAGIAELMFLSGELWENHPCCVVAMRREFVESHTDAANEFVELLVQAGDFIHSQPEAAARIAADFLDPQGKLALTPPLLKSVLTQPFGIATDDLFPVIEDLDGIQRYMREKMGIGKIIDLEAFVDTRFAEAAYKGSSPRKRLLKIHGVDSAVARMIQNRIVRAGLKPPISVNDKAGNGFKAVKNESSIHFRISSDMKLVDRVILDVRDFLKLFKFESFSGMNLILRELMINAVEHGNKFITHKQIACEVTHMGENLFRIAVEDEGDGFDYAGLDMSIPSDPNQVRKRGYPFINAFGEQIEFNTKGNRITVFHRPYKRTRFDAENENGFIVIRPSGDITAGEIEELRALLKKLLEKGHTKFRFDLSKVQDIDSVGLSAFIVLNKLLESQDEEKYLEIVNTGPDLANLFRIAHLDGTYRISE